MPALERLAREGVSFSHAFTPCPTCVPARQSLLCGQWPQVHGGLWNYGIGLPTRYFEEPTWTEALAASGYALGYVGKWEIHPTRGPTEYGFREWANAKDYAAWREGRGLGALQPDSERMEMLRDKPVTRWFGGVDPAPVEQSRTHWYAERAIEMIRRYSEEGKPWHVRLDFEEPHLPCYPAGRYAEMYPPGDIPPWGSFSETFAGKPYIQRQQLVSWGIEGLTWREWSVYLSRYLGMLSQIDDAVGRVLAALDEMGLAENTLVIYTTDHGDNCGGHRLIDKHYVMYEDVVRVPLVLRWPGTLAEGLVREEFVSHALDLASTACEAGGLPVPDNYQGRSLLPLCRGEQVERMAAGYRLHVQRGAVRALYAAHAARPPVQIRVEPHGCGRAVRPGGRSVGAAQRGGASGVCRDAAGDALAAAGAIDGAGGWGRADGLDQEAAERGEKDRRLSEGRLPWGISRFPTDEHRWRRMNTDGD